MSILPVNAASPAVQAFDALAPLFDARFSAWKSVAAQRAAVRAELVRTFPEGASLLEIGGGTGEDALFLAERGYRIHFTDGARSMVEHARRKIGATEFAGRVTFDCAPIERLDTIPAATEFDGCYSNFAAFNCVDDYAAPAQALARLLRPGAFAALVIFGPFCPGEIVTLLARGEGRKAFRRLSRNGVAARVGGHSFTVSYPSPRAFARSFAPWFSLASTRGIGVFVPPSSAEPWISAHPRFLSVLERLDRAVSSPLTPLGDHILVKLERTQVPA